VVFAAHAVATVSAAIAHADVLARAYFLVALVTGSLFLHVVTTRAAQPIATPGALRRPG
jgi:hypothetical protein